jgi:glycosyltransferase involved in cell wall biosynthesis
LLPNLFSCVESQRTDGLFTYDLVVVDNDNARSAERVVQDFAASSHLKVTYCVEPQQNISLARNRALAQASGDLLAFIDDDEVPASDWLYELFQTRAKSRADGVLGPVVSRFQETPPQWVTKGKFFDRPRRPTSVAVAWPEARTGNVLVAKDILRDLHPPFRPQFGSGGEDVDFFRRLITSGRRFVWCDEAVVYEWVPPSRCTRRFLIGRAVLRGSNFPKQSGARLKNILKSVVAVPSYVVALPFLAMVGHHHFVAYLVKLSDHASRLLALAGVRLATQREN